MNSRTSQISACVIVILIGLLLAAKVIHDSTVAEEARRAARAKAVAEMTAKAIEKVTERKVENAADVQACIDKGGIPIKTLVLGRLKRCDFPGKK